MGFLDFFKRLKQKAQGQLEGQKVKTIKFEELEEVIKQKQEKNKKNK